MTSNDANLEAGETQWVSTRQWDKSGGITDKVIGEIRKTIDDEFNDNVRRLMRSKQSEPWMTVEPQKRRTVRISKKWTEPAKRRVPTPSKQMEPDEPLSQPRATSSVFVFGTTDTTCREGKNKPQEEDSTVCSNETYSTFQRPKERRRCKPTAWCYIKHGSKAFHRLTITNRRHHHKLGKGRRSPDVQFNVFDSPQNKSSE